MRQPQRPPNSQKQGKNTMSGNNDFSAIKIGSRVRHSSDGVTGRIAWANATTVTVQWDDGEKVTWKRTDLAAKGLEILDEDQAPETPVEAETQAPAEPAPEATPAEAACETAAETTPVPTPDGMPAIQETTADRGSDHLATVILSDKDDSASALQQPTETATRPAKRARRTKAADAKPAGEKKVSSIDAAAKVLAEEGKPMNCQEMIGAMAAKGYWTSPGGKTPAATLYSALLREIDTKGEGARFAKVGKGMFALRTQA
jgi:hypothetical protein